MTRVEAMELVALLMASYPTHKLNGPNARAYETMILDLEQPACAKAIHRWVTTSKWFPSIAEIREETFKVEQGAELTGSEAWAIALAGVRRVGSYDPEPKWPEPLIGEALRLFGGWRDFCLTPQDDPAGRARFIDHYEALSRRRRHVRGELPAGPVAKEAGELVEGLADKLGGGADVGELQRKQVVQPQDAGAGELRPQVRGQQPLSKVRVGSAEEPAPDGASAPPGHDGGEPQPAPKGARAPKHSGRSTTRRGRAGKGE